MHIHIIIYFKSDVYKQISIVVYVITIIINKNKNGNIIKLAKWCNIK